jgi:hypothetical protein
MTGQPAPGTPGGAEARHETGASGDTEACDDAGAASGAAASSGREARGGTEASSGTEARGDTGAPGDTGARDEAGACDGTAAAGGAAGSRLSELADEALIRRLRRVATEADPVPNSLYLAARAAFALRDLDARVAELVRDSVLDAPLVAVRAARAEDARMLSFEAGSTVIECEVTTRAGNRDISGQLSGAAATSVAAEVAGQPPVLAEVRAHGFFSVRGLPPGPFRLTCQLAGGATIATSWTPV